MRRAGLAAVAVLSILAAGCVVPRSRREIEEEALDVAFDVTLLRLTNQNVREAAWWFRPYYGRLVRRLDRETVAPTAVLTLCHGRAYAVRKLEPFLKTEREEKLVLIAVLVHGLSYNLHPGARFILRSMGRGDRLVVAALNPPPKAAAWADDEARKEAGAEPKDWKLLTDEQKWEKLRAAWDETSADPPIPEPPAAR